MTNPKSKGNGYERKISNLLSTRFKAKTGMDKAFRRNADSGSFFGGSNVRRASTHNTEKATFGDIICPSNFAFSIECKHYKAAPSFALVMKQDVKDWDKWLVQASQDAQTSNKKMMLVIKYNNVDEFVILDETFGLTPIINYKGRFVVSLEEFLKLDDSIFFED